VSGRQKVATDKRNVFAWVCAFHVTSFLLLNNQLRDIAECSHVIESFV